MKFARVLASAGAVMVMAVAPLAGAATALADTPGVICGSDCLPADSVSTPVGLVTVTVSPAAVVTVALTPTLPGTLVFGLAFTFPEPPIAGCPGGCIRARTSITTDGILVNIDTVLIPPGPPLRFSVPSLAVISIHPPSPCRVRVAGTTVTFTPIAAP